MLAQSAEIDAVAEAPAEPLPRKKFSLGESIVVLAAQVVVFAIVLLLPVVCCGIVWFCLKVGEFITKARASRIQKFEAADERAFIPYGPLS
jgi:hypothetical protein